MGCWCGIPEHIRSDNGPEFIAQELRKWLGKVGTGTLYIEPGSPWENGYCESLNGKLRDEFLSGEIFPQFINSGCTEKGGFTSLRRLFGFFGVNE
jgi:transposase InsO family protein